MLFRNPYFSLLRTAWQYARDQKRTYLRVYGAFALSNLMTSLFPLLWGMLIDQLQREGANALRTVWIYGGAYLLIHFLDWAFHGPARILERRLSFDLSRNFLQELFHKTLRLPVSWQQDHHSGATINRVRKAYESLRNFFDEGFMYFQTLAKMFFALVAMIYFSPLFGGVAVLLGLGVLWIILRFDKPFIAASRETNEREHEVSSSLFDSLSNIITVITLRLEKRMEDGVLARVGAVWPPFRRKVLVNEWKWFVVTSCIALLYAIIVVGYVHQNWQPGEVFLIGGLVTLVGYVTQFTGVFHSFAWQYTSVVRYHTDVEGARSILTAYQQQHRPESLGILPAGWRQIEIEGLSYRHRANDGHGLSAQGLENLHVALPRGRRVAFIGASGSGKSTLLALLRGLHTPEAAQLRVDGQPLPGLSALAERVTLLPQEPEIFEHTIEYNITLGLPFGADEVARVCEIAAFSEVVAQLPHGLQSSIKEKGVNLSGGQKQRLALARGILAARDSDLVLLDEPTSSVDPKTELQIYQRLFAEFADKALVSSLHRLHLLVHFDYVYVLEQGRVVAEGTFEYLRRHSTHFQALWKHQEEGMRLDETTENKPTESALPA